MKYDNIQAELARFEQLFSQRMERAATWLVRSENSYWSHKECGMYERLDCLSKASECTHKNRCIFSTARAVMALCRALPIIQKRDERNPRWETVKEGEVIRAITEGVEFLLSTAKKDSYLQRKGKVFYFWVSSDMQEIEFTRATSAVIYALLECRKLIRSKDIMNIQLQSEVEEKILGGIRWILETQVRETDFEYVGKKKRSLGHYSISYRGSWMNIPSHIIRDIESFIYMKFPFGYEGLKAMCHYGSRCRNGRIEPKEMENVLRNEYIRAVAEHVGYDYIGDILSAGHETEFNTAATKEAMAALNEFVKSNWGNEDYMMEKSKESIKEAMGCLLRQRNKEGLWSNLLCLNMHVASELLAAGANPEDIRIDENLGDELREKLNAAMGGDTCLLVSWSLLRYGLCGNEEISPKKLVALCNRIENRLYPQRSIFVEYYLDNQDKPSTSQTSWVVFMLSKILEAFGRREPPAIYLGNDKQYRDVCWWPNHTENPNLLVIGGPGSGKSNCLRLIALELAKKGIPLLIFDIKKDFQSRDFLREINATLINPEMDSIPINPLDLFPANPQNPRNRINRISSMFENILGLTPREKGCLKKAIKSAYESCGISEIRETWDKEPPTFSMIRTSLDEIQSNNNGEEIKNLISKIDPLFQYELLSSHGESPRTGILKKTYVVNLTQITDDKTRYAFCELIINYLLDYMNVLGSDSSESLKFCCIIDEVHNILRKGSSLINLLRMGRAYGIGVILASQQPSDFPSEAFQNTASRIIFRPGDLSEIPKLASELTEDKKNEIAKEIGNLRGFWALFQSDGLFQMVKTEKIEREYEVPNES